MKKYCIICETPIHGRRRKYCDKCRSEVRKQQMKDYYKNNKCKWLCINGKYNKKNTGQICTVPFNDHKYGSHKIELMAIEEEMKRLGLKPIKHKNKNLTKELPLTLNHSTITFKYY